MNILLAIYMALAAAPQEPVFLDIPSLPGTWDNPLSEHPLFHRFIEKLESRIEQVYGKDALVMEVISKVSTGIPISLGTDWAENAPLDTLALDVRNDGERIVKVGISFVLADGKRVASAMQELPPGDWRLLEYDMLEAAPPQPAGKRADVVRIELQLQNLHAQTPYQIAFSKLKFIPLPLPASLTIQPITLKSQAGETAKLQWPSVSGEPVEGKLPVDLAIERNGHVFLKAKSHIISTNGSPNLTPVNLSLPRGCPGGVYSIYADTYRVPITDQPSRRALLGHLEVTEAVAGKPIKAHIAPFNGAPTLHLNDKPVTGLTYMTYRLDERYVRQFAEAGVELVSFGTCSGIHPYGLAAPSWPEPDIFDFSQSDARITRILSANPQAKILIRCYMGTPKWWSEANAEECVVGITPQGKYVDYEEPQGHRPGSWASEKWRVDMCGGLRQFMLHLRSAPYSDHIIGLMICAGTTEEWMAPGSNVPIAADYSKPSRAGFREWLRHKYETEGGLRFAWNDNAATFANVEPPGLEELKAAGKGDFLKLPEQQKLADWWSYISFLTADTIQNFARIVKTGSDGDWLCGTFYGYVLQFHEPRIVRAGHLEIDRLARSPYLDFFSSPTLYSHRSLKPGGYSTFMSLTESYKLHNKLWWNENDIRTFRVLDVPNTHADQIDRRQTLEETLALLRRELGNVIAHGISQWYFDMGGGWYDDPRLLAEVEQQAELAKRLMEMDRSSVSEIAVVIDPGAFTLQSLSTRLNSWLVLGQIASLGQMGAPFDLVTLGDMENLPQRKMWIFLNLLALDEEKVARIHERLRRDKAMGVFVYASGLMSGVDGMRQITGMSIVTDWERRSVNVAVSPDFLGLNQESIYGTNSLVGPVRLPAGEIAPTFHVADESVEVLGSDTTTNLPGLVIKQMDGWTSVYSSAPGISAPVLRGLAKKAGAHIYVEEDAVVYAGASILSITVVEPGTRQIHLPRAYTVKDAMNGELIAGQTTTFELDFTERESRLFLLIVP